MTGSFRLLRVAGIDDVIRLGGAMTLAEAQEALQISAFQKLAWERRTLLERREAA